MHSSSYTCPPPPPFLKTPKVPRGILEMGCEDFLFFWKIFEEPSRGWLMCPKNAGGVEDKACWDRK